MLYIQITHIEGWENENFEENLNFDIPEFESPSHLTQFGESIHKGTAEKDQGGKKTLNDLRIVRNSPIQTSLNMIFRHFGKKYIKALKCHQFPKQEILQKQKIVLDSLIYKLSKLLNTVTVNPCAVRPPIYGKRPPFLVFQGYPIEITSV